MRGSAGRRLGGAYPGERAGMRGGEILVHGDAGDEAGAGLRRGLIAVAGRTGDAAGLSALAGTIVAFGALGTHPGAGMRRASIVAMTEPGLLPTYARACTYRPPFLRLCLRRLRELGLPVTDAQIEGRYTRWSGDGLELRRGEILILEPPDDPVAERAGRRLADRLADDADALRVAVKRCPAARGSSTAAARSRAASRPGAGSQRSRWPASARSRGRRSCSRAAGSPGSPSSPTIRRWRASARSTPAGRSSATTTSRWPAARAAR